MSNKYIEIPLDQLFFESIVGKSVSHFYELAKKSYKDGDYSASIALCTRCLYLGENEVNFESTKPLSLIAQNLYKSNMERWIFLRPLAVGIVIRSNRNRRAFSEILTDSGINLGIADWAVLILLIARIILFERWGIFPKSSRAVLKKLFNAMLKN